MRPIDMARRDILDNVIFHNLLETQNFFHGSKQDRNIGSADTSRIETTKTSLQNGLIYDLSCIAHRRRPWPIKI